MYDVERIALLPALRLHRGISAITVSRRYSGALVTVDQLRHHSQASEILLLLAHAPQAQIYRLELFHLRLVEEDFLGATVRQCVSISTKTVACLVDHSRVPIKAFFCGVQAFFEKVDTMFGEGDCIVILDYKAPLVAFLKCGGAVAEPDEVPLIAIGRPRPLARLDTSDVLGTLRKEDKLIFQIHIPIGIIFHHKGGLEVLVDDSKVCSASGAEL